MYTDLRMFDQARELIVLQDAANVTGVPDEKALLKKKADWAANTNEHRTAVETYLSAGEYLMAIEIAGNNGWIEM